jgi:hypothetical protein
LASLRELVVYDTPSALVQGVTQLTSLQMLGQDDTLAELAAVLSGMSNLQQLELGGSLSNGIPAEALQLMLVTCTQLSKLTLHARIEQQQFRMLLRQAPQLAHFTCRCLILTEDMSQAACSLRELVMQCQYLDLCTLAYLPLHSLSYVSFHVHSLQLPTARPELQLHCSHIAGNPGGRPNTIHAALANLERCPAWQQSGTTVHIRVIRDDVEGDSFFQVFEALSAVTSRRVQLTLHAESALLQESTVHKLGRALGERLVDLKLQDCLLCEDFWAAVWAHLPGLQHLTLWDPSPGPGTANLEVSQETLTTFCSHATHQLQLRLGRKLYDRLGVSSWRLEEQSRGPGEEGVPQVTVEVING